ncbi:uncharacterized protein LOC131249660 [Magnolia sinica]|uniref:uncharacterized protein LOC131249660 n=1 Tax=Magnolia sinica TaxID=86752 RepID=UPI0026584990|nr:uncharacterized protein LOC131249660 [Magnolia sinica]
MSLLETITIAKSESQTPKTPSKHSIILNPDPIFPLLKPEPKSSSNNLINPITGWQISAVDSHVIESNHRFFSKLKRKLKSPNTLTSDEFLRILNSFLEKTREGIGLSIGVGPTDPDYTRLAISKLAFVISRDVAGLISEACVALGLWELTDALIAHGLVVGCSSSVNLIEDLIRKNRSNSICLYIRSVSDLRSSELLLILKYFLSPSKDGYHSMISVRKEWERLAILSTEKAIENTLTKEKSRLARQAAVLLMMAHDGFSAYELCLHYLFGSNNVDGLALSWAVARLDGSEVLRLVKYLGKWLRKYEKFPEAGPCPGAVALGLEACEWVPTVDSIVGCLAVVLDEHFSYLALYNELHEEMRSMEKLVRSFTAEAELCCSVASLIENLRADAGSRGGA